MLFYFIVCVYKVSFCLNFTICSKKNNAFSRVVHLQCMRTARNNLTVGPFRDDGELGDVRVRVTEGGDEQLLLTGLLYQLTDHEEGLQWRTSQGPLKVPILKNSISILTHFWRDPLFSKSFLIFNFQ